jgi:hypothetical protein
MTTTGDEVTSRLAAIIGLALRRTHRAADMQVFHFAALDADLEDEDNVHSLHIQSAWRIRNETTLICGSDDLWAAVSGQDIPEGFDYEKGNLRDERLATVIGPHAPSVLRVRAIDVFEHGDLHVLLTEGLIIEVFASSARDELWRFFRGAEDHLVAYSRGVEN